MQLYTRRTFEANEEQKARRFGYRVKGICTFSQYLDENGNLKSGYCVEYIPREPKKA